MGNLLTGPELAEVREEMLILLPEIGRVLTQTQVKTAGGGYKETFVPGDDMPCAIKPVMAANGMSGGRIDDRTTDLLQVPAETEIRPVDRFEVDGWGTFEVTFVRRRSEELLRTVEVKAVF
jgi:hypothetical protein